MADKPILFSGPMVRALLDGRKTQTRRVLKPQPPEASHFHGKLNAQSGQVAVFSHPLSREQWNRSLKINLSDRLWVREHWKAGPAYDDLPPRDLSGEECLLYLADNFEQKWGWEHPQKYGRHRQGMHMPRWASRLTLVVTDVRVQRLQDISETDAIAEGCSGGETRDDVSGVSEGWSARTSFRTLWDNLNAKRGFGWDTNPWVTATTFTVHMCNIDQMEDEV